jgi:ABC transporter
VQLEVAIAHKAFTNAAGERHEVLADVNFALSAGEVGVFVGPSGCGKTTMLKILAGLDHDYQGRVTRPADARIGMVFQEPRLLPWRSVEENVRLAAPRADEAKLSALFAILELNAHRSHFPGELSLGLARRVSLPRGRGRTGFPYPRRAAGVARRCPCHPSARPNCHVGGQPLRVDSACHPRRRRCGSPRRPRVPLVSAPGQDPCGSANSQASQGAWRNRDRCDQGRHRAADQWRSHRARCLIGSA